MLTEIKRVDWHFFMWSLQLLHDSCHGRYRHLVDGQRTAQSKYPEKYNSINKTISTPFV